MSLYSMISTRRQRAKWLRRDIQDCSSAPGGKQHETKIGVWEISARHMSPALPIHIPIFGWLKLTKTPYLFYLKDWDEILYGLSSFHKLNIIHLRCFNCKCTLVLIIPLRCHIFCLITFLSIHRVNLCLRTGNDKWMWLIILVKSQPRKEIFGAVVNKSLQSVFLNTPRRNDTLILS